MKTIMIKTVGNLCKINQTHSSQVLEAEENRSFTEKERVKNNKQRAKN